MANRNVQGLFSPRLIAGSLSLTHEQQVLNALNIKSFRNLSKEKIMVEGKVLRTKL